MRNVFKIVSSVGSVALLLSGAAMAVTPILPGTWTVNTAGLIGNVSPAANACTGEIVGAGFHQCNLSIGGRTYVQTIIAEAVNPFSAAAPTAIPLPALAFRSQDFVQIGGGSAPGLASNMRIQDTATNPGTTFTTEAIIDTGWATAAALGGAPLSRSISDLRLTLNTPGAAGANELFASDFRVVAVTTLANALLVTNLNVGQTVGLGVSPTGPSVDKQRFELRNAPTTIAPITAYILGGLAANPNGGAVTSALGQTLQGVWIGQRVAGDDFASQRLTNQVTTPAAGSTTSLTSLASVAAVDWATAGVFFTQFGAIPGF